MRLTDSLLGYKSQSICTHTHKHAHMDLGSRWAGLVGEFLMGDVALLLVFLCLHWQVLLPQQIQTS